MKKLARQLVGGAITLAAVLFWVSFIVTTCAPKQAFPAEISQKYLTERDYRVIKEHWQDYKYAANKTGVPVLILPAIHYREANLFQGWYSFKRQEVVKNIGGPFMLDLGPLNDGIEFEKRIRAYEKMVYNLYVGEVSKIPKVSHVFRFSALVAAHHLKAHSRCVGWTGECLEDAVWGYNGRASWCKRSESPYLWSDPKNGVNLTMRYKKHNGEIVKFTDTRPGVMVLYKELSETLKDRK